MAISPCNTTIDGAQRELVEHGTAAFPIGCYHDDLSQEGVMWHWHDELEYAIAMNCPCTFLVEGEAVTLAPGDGIFINHQVLHAVERSREPNSRLRSAVFHPRLISGSRDSIFWEGILDPILSQSGLRYLVLKQQEPWQAGVLGHFHQAWEGMDQEPVDFENLVRYHLTGALSAIVRNTPMVPKALSEQARLSAARVRSILDYLHDHYPYDITMEDIVGQVHVSSSVCLRSFQKMVGVSPMRYLKNYRLDQAKGMLRTTEVTVKEIALCCGFNDISYFTKSFREKFGCTPLEYRKQRRQQTKGG